jgi:hypothetical protein
MRRAPSDMTTNQTLLLALGSFAVLIVIFFRSFSGKGKFSIKSKLGEVRAEGENPLPPGKVATGVSIEGADAGGNLTAHSASEGGVGVKGAKVGGHIKATHEPGQPSPKR